MKKYLQSSWFYGLSVLAIFIAHTVLSYWAVIRDKYPIGPGDDIGVHLNLIRNIQQSGYVLYSKDYPRGVHDFFAIVSNWSHLPAETILSYSWPALLVLSGLAIWFLASVVFGKKVGLVSYLLYSLMSFQPLQTARDGGLPNLVGSNIFLPLLLAALVWVVRSKRLWARIASIGTVIVLFIAISLTHHLSTFVALVVLVACVAALTTYLLTIYRSKAVVPVLLMVILMLFGLGLFAYLPLFNAARQLFSTSWGTTSSGVWTIANYSTSINGLIFQFSAVGFLVAIYLAFKNRRPDYLIILSWFAVYFIGSRLPTINEPGRLARDLAMPASVLSGYAIFKIYSWTRNDKLMRAVFLVVISLLVIYSIHDKAKGQLSFNSMVRFSRADQQAENYITQNLNGSTSCLIWDRTNVFWHLMASDTVKHNCQIVSALPDPSALAKGSVVIAGYYSPAVWPDSLHQEGVINSYLTNLKNQEIGSDPNKVWFVFWGR